MPINPREAMSPLTPSDHVNWNESQFVWWYDVESGIAGFHRIAHQPNRMNSNLWSSIVTASGRCFRRVDTAVPFDPAFRANGAYRTEGLELRHHGRGGVDIRSEYPGCSVRLTLEDSFPAINLSHDGDQYNQGTDLREAHFEAAGTITGTVEIDGTRYDVDCLGYRDHSWGPRDLIRLQASMWAAGTTGTTAFIFGKSLVRGKAPFISGYLWRDGTLQAVTEVDATVELEFDGVTYRGATAKVTTTDGVVHEVVYSKPMGGVVVTLDSWIGYESACEITIDGERGIGDWERAINPCGGSLLPELAVHAVITDGLSDHVELDPNNVMRRKWDVAGATT